MIAVMIQHKGSLLSLASLSHSKTFFAKELVTNGFATLRFRGF